MSKQSWDTKYRPSTWKEYVGNERVKERLSLALEKDSLPQTIMLEGDMGTGKTTMARLLAKSLMCSNPQKGIACGKCKNCEILDSKFIKHGGRVSGLPVYEYNMAEKKGVDDALEIVEIMKENTILQKKRVFILDEIQRISEQAQATYLKLLEEPPEGLYVIFCTTDPEDLLRTLRSRLHSYKIKKPSAKIISDRVAEICTIEGTNYTMSALKLLAVKSDRILRDSIKNAERLSIYGTINTNLVNEEFGVISEDIYMDYLDTLKSGRTFEIVEQSARLVEEQLSMKEFLTGLGNFLVLLVNAKSSVKIEEYDAGKIKEYRKYLDNFTEQQIIDLLILIRKYSTNIQNEPFYLYSLSMEASKIFNLTDTKVNIKENVVDKNHKKITEKIKDSKKSNMNITSSEEDIMSSFDKIKPVK